MEEGDRVQLDLGTAFTVSQMGGNTLVTMGAGSVLMVIDSAGSG